MAFDLAGEIEESSRFVIVDDFEITGGGIISEALEDEQSWIREKVMRRNYKWEQSLISREERAEKYNQKSTLILITGEEDVGKKPTAKALEKDYLMMVKLFIFWGLVIYFMVLMLILKMVIMKRKRRAFASFS